MSRWPSLLSIDSSVFCLFLSRAGGLCGHTRPQPEAVSQTALLASTASHQPAPQNAHQGLLASRTSPALRSTVNTGKPESTTYTPCNSTGRCTGKTGKRGGKEWTTLPSHQAHPDFRVRFQPLQFFDPPAINTTTTTTTTTSDPRKIFDSITQPHCIHSPPQLSYSASKPSRVFTIKQPYSKLCSNNHNNIPFSNQIFRAFDNHNGWWKGQVIWW